MTDNSEGSEPIKMTEEQRIEKEADEYLKTSRWMESWKTTESKLAYIAGATAEHRLLKPQLEYADNTIKKLHEAMVSAERRGHDKAMEEMKARDENATDILKEERNKAIDDALIILKNYTGAFTNYSHLQELKGELESLKK